MKTDFALPIFLLSVAGHSPLARAQSPGTFTAIASMATARVSHTATLLLDGRVLIVGGRGGTAADLDAATSATEIYDPGKLTFTSAGNMTTARSGHTATLLPDGRVLIVGGDSIGSAELYDPATGSFTATGSLLTARQGFNATLLTNGKVLITGGMAGSISSGVIGDAEFYDPSTGVFTAAGSYAGALAGLATNVDAFASTSTLLPDGTVLFATEPSAQVYDPVNAAFSLKGAMLVSGPFGNPFAPDYISGQTANLLLNGKVLMAGGEQEDTGRYNTALLYDAGSGLFVPTGSMIKPRNQHTATLLPDGTVLMAGGQSQMCDANNYCYYSGTESSAELYDPVEGTFADAGTMTARRDGHTATLLNNGDVVLTGGEAQNGIIPGVPLGGPGGQTGGSYGITASAELYHPAKASPAPVLFSLSGDGRGQGAIWNAITGQVASAQAPAAAGDFLSLYVSGLVEGGTIPPQVIVDGRLAGILYFGDAPGYPGYFQINFRVPSGVAAGAAIPVRLTYLGRTSNSVTVGIH
jgi:hypothetical protein